MKMSKEELLALLCEIWAAVQANDSFEGNISYSCMEEGLGPNEYEVKGAYRVGNQDGQGGVRLLGE